MVEYLNCALAGFKIGRKRANRGSLATRLRNSFATTRLYFKLGMSCVFLMRTIGMAVASCYCIKYSRSFATLWAGVKKPYIFSMALPRRTGVRLAPLWQLLDEGQASGA